jgi:hypothetical protein
VVRSAVGKSVVRLTPNTFVWVEFRGVCGEAFQVETGIAAAEVPNRFSLVWLAIVPDDDEMAAQMPEQVA